MILRTRSTPLQRVYLQRNIIAVRAGAGTRQAGPTRRKSAAPAAFFVELAGEVEQPTVALEASRVDLPRGHGGLHGALRFPQVQAILEAAGVRLAEDLDEPALDLLERHDRRRV